VKLLRLEDPVEIVQGFDRPNLLWSVFQTDNKRRKVRDVIRAVEGAGIVYASTRRNVETWASWLRKQGHSAAAYHGGLDAETREKTQDAWIEDETRVMVATNAFGMGIDKPDVRFVVHVDVPSSLEAYYQEAGRGGRDGQPAYAVLLFQSPDADTQEALIEASHPSASEVRSVYDAVCNVGQVPMGSQPDGPVSVNLEAVLKITELSRGKVRTAVELLERQSAWNVLPRRKHYGLIRFSRSAGQVRRYADGLSNKALREFVQTLLRTVHADAFTDWWRIDLRRLVQRMDVPRARVQRGMMYLEDRGLLQWRPPGEALQVELEFPRSRKLPVDDRSVQMARKRAETRLKSMIRYAQSITCRRHFLLTYFGETSRERCGKCDVCMGRHRPETVTPKDEPILRQILASVAEGNVRETWADAISSPRYRVDALANWLVEEGYLQLDDPLEGQFSLTEKAESFLENGG